MGTFYKAEKRVEHFAAVVGPLFMPSVPFSARRVPRVPTVTFEESQGVAERVKGNSYSNIVVGTVCKGKAPVTFIPYEGNPKEQAQGRPVCFHGNYGVFAGPGAPPQPAPSTAA